MLNFENTIAEVDGSDVDLAILPLGSTEQHGSHLPLCTDCLTVSELGKRVAERLGAYLLPTIPITTCYEHKGRKGSLWMRPSTFYTMLEDILLCLHGQGFKKVAVLFGHGGIFAANPAIRELNATVDGLRVITVPSAPREVFADLVENPKFEVHAGEKETSMILALREDLVHMDEAAKNDCEPSVPREYLNHIPLTRLSSSGAWGKPSLATREKGEKLLQRMTEHYVRYIEDALKYAVEEAW